MTIGIHEGAWGETALITITRYTASDIQFAAMTETIDIDLGDKDIDQIPNLKGGMMIKKIPQAITTITFEGYPVFVGPGDDTEATGISQYFSDPDASISGGERNLTMKRTRAMFRIGICWTDDTAATSAVGAVAANSNFYRIMFVNAYMTSMKPSFTDGVLKFTFSFKVASFNKLGTSQIKEESARSADGNAQNSYNTTNFPVAGTVFTWVG